MCSDMGPRPSEGMLVFEDFVKPALAKAKKGGRALLCQRHSGVPRCNVPGHVLFCWLLAVLRMMALPSVLLVQHACDIHSTGATRISMRWGAAPWARCVSHSWGQHAAKLRSVVALRGGGEGKREAEGKAQRVGRAGEKGTKKEVVPAGGDDAGGSFFAESQVLPSAISTGRYLLSLSSFPCPAAWL